MIAESPYHTHRHIEVRPIAGALGAEIRGVDVARVLDSEVVAEIQQEPGSLAFWDNRCTQHNPVNDYHGFKRVMHRATLAGDTPV